MNDKELLELAAKAAGIRLEWGGGPDEWLPMYSEGKTYHYFNPLTDDGDALRLAVKLNLLVSIYGDFAVSDSDNTRHGWKFMVDEEKGVDAYAATRRAIVRASAEIGRNMK